MNSEMTAKDAQCSLEVSSFRLLAERIEFAYTVHNHSLSNVYLFNKVYRWVDEGGLYRTDHNLVYIELHNRRLVLSKKIIPVPEDIEVERPVVPCVTLVGLGESFSETVSVSLPLTLWTPYANSSLARSFSPQDYQIALEIGYFLLDPTAKQQARTVPTSDGPALYFYPFPIDLQQFLRADLL